MKKLFIALMCILTVFALSSCNPGSTEADSGLTPGTEEHTDPENPDGPDNPGGGQDNPDGPDNPGGQDNPDPDSVSVEMTLSSLEAGYARISLSGSITIKNSPTDWVRMKVYYKEADSSEEPSAADIVTGGNFAFSFDYNPNEEESHSKESFVNKLAVGTAYCFVGTADIDGTAYYSDVLSISTKDIDSIPETVDMGGGLLWRGWNLGADGPTGLGHLYAWGETEVKEHYDKDTYSFYKSYSYTKYTTLDKNAKSGKADGLTVLVDIDDAAAVKLGNGWRMPTMEEASAMIAACEKYWTSLDGVPGCLIENKTTGAVLFLPAENKNLCIWTSSLKTGSDYQEDNRAWYIYAGVDYFGQFKLEVADFYRYEGYYIRPVCAVAD